MATLFWPLLYITWYYTLHFIKTWTERKEGDPWPNGRDDHIAACLGYGGQHKTVLIRGGFDNNAVIHVDELFCCLRSFIFGARKLE